MNHKKAKSNCWISKTQVNQTLKQTTSKNRHRNSGGESQMNWLEYQIECKGMVETVQKVTDDPYILGYLEILKNSIQDHEKTTVNQVSKRLIDWYASQIDTILTNPFIYNKENQKKTYQLFTTLYQDTMPTGL